MLLTSRQLTRTAFENGFAVPAFNVNNLEMVQGVFAAAAASKSPIMVSTAESEIAFGGGNVIFRIIMGVAESYDVPFAVHLDHGPNFETVVQCIRRGYTSVMFDGSALPFDENLSETRRIVETAHAAGVSVEAEFGMLGGLDEMGTETREAMLTDPVKAGEFVRRTEVDLFAPAIGTAHGFYKGEPKLDFERLEKIRKQTDTPLVLHGGTGLPAKAIETAIGLGIAKINFSTFLRKSFLDAVRKFMAENPEELGTMSVMAPGRDALQQAAESLIQMCSANGKAGLYKEAVLTPIVA